MESKPGKSWSLKRLTTFVLTQIDASKVKERQAELLGRASAIHSIRVGHALSLVRDRLKETKEYMEWLKANKISTTRAWEDHELFRRAKTEAAVKDMTRTEAKLRFGIIKPRKNAIVVTVNHDAKKLLPLADYRITCCPIQELGEKAGLEKNSIDLCFAEAPWSKKALGVYQQVGQFAREYLKEGHLLLCYVGVLNLLDNARQLEEQGLQYVTCFSIQFPTMHSQSKLMGLKLRNGWRPVLVFSKGKYKPEFWVDDSQDGMGRQKQDDPMQTNAEELMYWVHKLTLPAGVRNEGQPADLVASLSGGVFSEAVACRRLARRFVGCEEVEWKCEVGRERLAEVTGVHTGPLYTRSRG